MTRHNFFWTRSFNLLIEDERRKSRERRIAALTPNAISVFRDHFTT